jgi:hypothetical protein
LKIERQTKVIIEIRLSAGEKIFPAGNSSPVPGHPAAMPEVAAATRRQAISKRKSQDAMPALLVTIRENESAFGTRDELLPLRVDPERPSVLVWAAHEFLPAIFSFRLFGRVPFRASDGRPVGGRAELSLS